MKRFALAVALSLAAALALPVAAGAAFGIHDFDVTFTDAEGQPVAEAGSHPFAMTTSFELNSEETPEGLYPEQAIKDLVITQIPGFAGDQTAVPRCTTAGFLTRLLLSLPDCPDSTAIGVATATVGTTVGQSPRSAPLYNLEPAPGSVARLGFWVEGVPVVIDIGLEEDPPYSIVATTSHISQVLEVYAAEILIWGVPGDPRHDDERGACLATAESCDAGVTPRPFLTVPRSCTGPLETTYEATPWAEPSNVVRGSATMPGFTGCGALDFSAEFSAQPRVRQAESAAGLDVDIEVDDEGIKNPADDARAASDLAAVELELPSGVTANPSAAEGLGVCGKAQYEAESLSTPAGSGCPPSSKLGTVAIETPLLENHPLSGSLYLARQDDPATPARGAENPFDSLLALYLVIRDRELGLFVKQAGEVTPTEGGPDAGRLVSRFADIPQFPLSDISVRLRQGPRAPLVTPPGCGIYTTTGRLVPWAGGAPLDLHSTFEIDSGPGGGPCPPSVPPFAPGFEAGTTSNAGGSFAPFAMRVARRDGEQDLTRFSASLPEGIVPKLTGIPWCPDAQLAVAALRNGREEQVAPSCPAASRIGGVLAGAGVGSALTYVPGSLYLAGPYKGAPLSVAAIVPAVAGPFDVGTVVTRVGLRLNPVTYRGEIDGGASDPIPHILKGIPLKLRDLRVIADRPEFTLNPTSCDEQSTDATLFGGFLDVFSTADDVAVGASSRYQAASCQSLGFKPRLGFRLKGGIRRGAFPSLRAVYTPRRGDANLAGLTVRLPRSAFLEQGHIGTICTRLQWAADACPPRSRYGYIRAWTPLLDAPLQGPVYLRSSNHNLPDLVFDLKGLVDVEVATRIDSVRGGIRARIGSAPDAPLSRVVLDMRGGHKGLIVNSRDLCRRPGRNRARANLIGQNGRRPTIKPVVRAVKCAKRRRKASKSHARASSSSSLLGAQRLMSG